MDVKKILHMNRGNDETSYAKNSKSQRKLLAMTKPIIEETVLKILGSNLMPVQSFGIADLGCSSGPNSLVVISEVMDVIHSRQTSTSEFRVFLNDLFSNDFNTISVSLPEFYDKFKPKDSEGPNLFVSAVPGSFYGRLFPTKSLHFVHSCSCLHWISQVPPGLEKAKGNIVISKSSPKLVAEAYTQQFRKDFSVFLKSRAEEVVSGGRMVLIFMGRRSLDPTVEDTCHLPFEILANALMSFVLEGSIEQEKFETFHNPNYAPCIEEVKVELEKEGSFIADHLEELEIDWDLTGPDVGDEHTNNTTKETVASSAGERVAKTMRAGMEPLLRSHFGEDLNMDTLFQRVAEVANDRFSKSRPKLIILVVSLVKK